MFAVFLESVVWTSKPSKGMFCFFLLMLCEFVVEFKTNAQFS